MCSDFVVAQEFILTFSGISAPGIGVLKSSPREIPVIEPQCDLYSVLILKGSRNCADRDSGSQNMELFN